MSKRSDKMYMWDATAHDFTLTSVAPTAVLPLNPSSATDPEAIAVPRTSVCRILGLVSWRCTSALTGLATSASPCLLLWVMYRDQDSTQLYSPQASVTADRPYVWVEYFPLRNDLVVGDEMINVDGASWARIDWKLRGGRGTTPRHDSELVFGATMVAVSAGTLLVSVCSRQLYKTT